MRSTDGIDDPVEAQLQAYNARDVDAFMACYTDDCVVDDADGVRMMAGHAQMRERCIALFAGSPNLHCTIVTRIRIGEYVMDEERITGRLSTPAGDTQHAVAVYKLRGNKICHVRFYRDQQKWT
ncbi:MAG: nuclear transport factor 2 family protein [Aeromicrobium sp.]|nr:nuclear transport factor 2 family protein [Burkholderiales bacterium]